MERSKKIIGYLVGFIILNMLFIGLLIMSNLLLREESNSSDAKAKALTRKNELLIKEYSSKIDSLATIQDNSSYTSGGKKVTISDIIKSANSWYQEKEKLKLELENCKAVQKVFEGSFNKATSLALEASNQGKESIKIAQENARVANSYKDLVKKFSPDKYREYEFFYKTVKKQFGLDYSIKQESDSIRTLTFEPNSKLDSALSIFESIKAGRIKTNINIKQESKRKN